MRCSRIAAQAVAAAEPGRGGEGVGVVDAEVQEMRTQVHSWVGWVSVATVLVLSTGVCPSGQCASPITWDRTFGGRGDDGADSVWVTRDGGYVVAGHTSSKGAGSWDVWVLRLSPAGDLLWDRTFGGEGFDAAYSVAETKDGGYIVGGITREKGARGSDGDDALVLRLDARGELLWQRRFGGAGRDGIRCVRQTSDGGYIAAGSTYSGGEDARGAWVLKLGPDGKVQWQRTYGGLSSVYAMEAGDGGYLLGGWTDEGICVTKLDEEGHVSWRRVLGERGRVPSIVRTRDGDWLVATDQPATVAKLSRSGKVLWRREVDEQASAPVLAAELASRGYIIVAPDTRQGSGQRNVSLLALTKSGEVLGLTW